LLILAVKKLNITLANGEAGLRSSDRTMPEEKRQLATDVIANLFFTTEKEVTANLHKEGHFASSVHFVSHIMIDNLFYQLKILY
jgi:UDP-N-acetylglucosamine 2-epimerase (non-hydrolysing)